MFESLSSFFSAPWVYHTFWAIYAVTVVTIIGVILSENRNPVKSLAWMVVLFMLPVVGIILYIFFGRSIKNQRMISRGNRRRLKRRDRARSVDVKALDLSESSRQQITLVRTLADSPLHAGNAVEVFTSGAEKFDALKRDLREARSYINMEYYIFEDDRVGREICDILVERAAAGVEVRLIYDHVGSFSVSSRFFKEMRRAGIQAHPFFKVSFPLLGTRINWRNHRKLVIIDGRIAYLGGMNIAERYIDGGKNFAGWRDTHLRLSGPIISSLSFSFAVDWNFMGQPLLDDEVSGEPVTAGAQGAVADVGMQLLTSGPMSQWSNIAYTFHKAIANARKRIYIQTPYFLPTDGLFKALQVAALAHVDVRLMLPETSDSRMLTYASASYVDEALKAGIKIYFYQAGMLHSKMILVDDEFSSVGSTNIDFRSFEYNFEANVMMYSVELNHQLAEIFKNDLTKSCRVSQPEWRRRPYTRKAVESIVRLLSPIL